MICTNKFDKFWLIIIFIVILSFICGCVTGGVCLHRNDNSEQLTTKSVATDVNSVEEITYNASNTSKIEPQSTNNSSVSKITSNNKTFRVTAYCACEQCCGKSDGITATGVKATAGRTIAVDPTVIPLGSIVVLDGKEYVAEDVGGSIKGNRLDIYFDDHQEALKFGVQYLEGEVIG